LSPLNRTAGIKCWKCDARSFIRKWHPRVRSSAFMLPSQGNLFPVCRMIYRKANGARYMTESYFLQTYKRVFIAHRWWLFVDRWYSFRSIFAKRRDVKCIWHVYRRIKRIKTAYRLVWFSWDDWWSLCQSYKLVSNYINRISTPESGDWNGVRYHEWNDTLINETDVPLNL